MSDNEFKLNQTRIIESSTLYEGYNGDYASTNALGEESEADYPRFDRGDDDVEWAITGALGEEATPIYPQEDNRLGDARVDQEDFPMMTTNALGEEGDAEPVGTIGSPNPGTGPLPIIVDEPKAIDIECPPEPIECGGAPVIYIKDKFTGSDDKNVEWAITNALGEEATPIYPQENGREDDVAPTIKVTVEDPIECYGSEENDVVPTIKVDGIRPHPEDFLDGNKTSDGTGTIGSPNPGTGPTPIIVDEPKVMDPIECYGPEENDVAPTIEIKVLPPIECYGENEGTPLKDLPTWEPTIYLGDDFIIEKDVDDMFSENSFNLEDVISTGEDNLDTLLGHVGSESAPKEVAAQDTARFVETDHDMFNTQHIDVDVI